jgi:hypothetical protein
MQEGTMKRTAPTLGILVALAAFHPATAQDNSFKIFAAASYVSPLGSEEEVTISSVTDSVQASNEVGWEAGVEFRFGKWMGLEVSYLNATQDVEFGDTTIAKVDFTPYNLALNFHLIHSKYFDFYIAPVAAFVDWGDIDFTDGTSEAADSEIAYGAAIGLDIGLGKTFAIIGGVRWLSLDITPDDPMVPDDESLAVDPLFARVGVALRF